MNADSQPPTFLLALMRHAKSDWADPGLSDHDRPLNARGRRDAPAMAHWLAQQRFVPDRILASSAARVRETVDGLLSVWSHRPSVAFSQSLYLPSPRTILEHVRCEAWLDDRRRAAMVLVVSHNPAIEQLASALAGEPIRMPTAAVAIFECNAMDEGDLQAPRVRCCAAIGRPKEI